MRTRHWIITDASGRKQEVRGEGVVGEQPVLAPGERFEYTRGVPLPTASGFMTGRYQMVKRERRAVRDRRADLFARQPRQQAGVELSGEGSFHLLACQGNRQSSSRAMTLSGVTPSLRREARAIQLSCSPRDGLLRAACHRARIRATRWLAMTIGHELRDLAARFARGFVSSFRPLRSEGAGNAGRPMRPQPRVQVVVETHTR